MSDTFEDDLRHALRRIGDAVPIGQPIGSSIRLSPPVTSRRRVLVLAGGMAAVVGGLTLVRRRGKRPSPPSSVPVVAWTVVDDAERLFSARAGDPIEPSSNSAEAIAQPNSITLNGVVGTPHGIVVVGHEGTRFGSVGAIWTSPDGRSWSRAGDDPALFGEHTRPANPTQGRGTSVGFVTESAGIVVAVGVDATSERVFDGTTSTSSTVAWTSTDGSSWERFTLDPDTGSSWSVAGLAVANGLFCSLVSVRDRPGSDDARWFVWQSANGVSWTRAAIRVDGTEPRASMDVAGVTSVGGGYIAVGSIDRRPAVWTSADGIDWSQRPLDFDPKAPSDIGLLWSVAYADGTAVALGTHTSENAAFGSNGGPARFHGESRAIAWRSVDGRTWRRVDLGDAIGTINSVAGPIAANDGGFVAQVRAITDAGYTNVTLVSADGLDWNRGPEPPVGRRHAIAVTPDGFVAVGNAVDDVMMRPPAQGDPSNDSTIWLTR